MKDCASFDDVLLVPQYSEIESRKDVSLKSYLGKIELDLPIVSSPMDTVTESGMAVAMHSNGGVGIIHRYNSIEDQAFLVHESRSCNVGAAIGASGNYIDRALAVVEAGANILCVDIAHGHHILMRQALTTLRRLFGSGVHIMAGNVATLDGFNALADWGADSIRVGIGGGSICSTRIQTGHGMPTLQSVIECSYSDRDVVLIADGGIRNSGDIVKSLAAGADFVMLGSLLAGAPESPGEIIHHRGEQWKVYRGMASYDAQINWRGHTSSVEGVSSKVLLKGPIGDVLDELSTNIKSGLSYSGALNIRELQAKSQFVRQSFAGMTESNTHIFSSQA